MSDTSLTNDSDVVSITVLTHSVGVGGVGKSVITLCNYLTKTERRVTLILLNVKEEEPFIPLDPNVLFIWIPATFLGHASLRRWFGYPQLVRILRREIVESHPKLIISFMDWINVLTILATRGLRIPVVVSERGNPRRPTLHLFWKLLRRIVYPKAQGIVAVSEGVLSYFSNMNHHVAVSISGATSPPSPEVLEVFKRSKDSHRMIVATIGRLEEEKGIDLLIRAFARLVNEFPDWDLYIWGMGAEEPKLKKLINDLQIQGRVLLKGEARDPYQVLACIDIFALPSRSEGHPNALVEAMACGLPVVSFDCQEGPREIVVNGHNGLLVPPENVDEFSDALASLMRSSVQRQRFGAAATEILQKCGNAVVMSKWEELLSAFNLRRSDK